jgi:alpha-tubulin suppressor-like RCC1 family protein
VCNDTCVNKGSDQNNCGTCNDVCVVGCSAGACANVLQLAAGTSTSFAALSDGTARGWGIDSQGDLGNGYTNTGAATKATLVAGLSNVAGVARGGRCAWLASGAPYCWGPNDYGELGDGTTNMQLSPVPVSGLTQVAGMAAGSEFTCAWNAAGSAWCWGTLGGTVPVAISGLSNVVEMAGGLLHVCARTTAGSVYCWGDNSSGQCGGTTSTLTSPTQVAGIANAVQIATGDLHTCALTSSGNVYCWGWNQYGQIGDGSSGSNHTTPTLVTTSSGGPALGSVSQVGAGSGHTCARLSNGTVECWGWNQDGELGDGTSITRSSPGPVTAISTAANDMAVYGEHVCTRVASGAVQCWGNDTFGDAPSIVQW